MAAKSISPEQSGEALEKLCQAYWYPVYAFVRRRGHGPHEAQDLTQGFFARFLEKNYVEAADVLKGKFRTFLVTAVTRFLANEFDRAQALKRGGGTTLLSLDEESAEERYQLEPANELTPARLYDQQWAQTILQRVLGRLREEFDGDGRVGRFEQLKIFLLEDKGAVSYAEVAARLGLSESAVKSGIWRLRQRYAELIRDEIAQTVTNGAEVEEEIRHFVEALAG